MRMGIVMQQQHPFSEEAWSLPVNGGTKFRQNRAVRGRHNSVAMLLSSTRCNFSGVAISTSRSARCSSLILVRPSENFCTQLWTDTTGNVHCTWAAFLCGYPLLPFFLPTKKRTTPRCSIVVHVLRGAAIL